MIEVLIVHNFSQSFQFNWNQLVSIDSTWEKEIEDEQMVSHSMVCHSLILWSCTPLGYPLSFDNWTKVTNDKAKYRKVPQSTSTLYKSASTSRLKRTRTSYFRKCPRAYVDSELLCEILSYALRSSRKPSCCFVRLLNCSLQSRSAATYLGHKPTCSGLTQGNLSCSCNFAIIFITCYIWSSDQYLEKMTNSGSIGFEPNKKKE